MRKYQKQQGNTQRSRFILADKNQREGTASNDPVSALPESLLDIDGLCQFLNLGKTKVSWLINREDLPSISLGELTASIAWKYGNGCRIDAIWCNVRGMQQVG